VPGNLLNKVKQVAKGRETEKLVAQTKLAEAISAFGSLCRVKDTTRAADSHIVIPKEAC
jgi:hypothetical protein